MRVVRATPPVAGRWGESQAVPGTPTVANPNPPPTYLSMVTTNYTNRIRAGFSLDISDLRRRHPRDVADDNFNSFDPYPPLGMRLGEVGDLDFLDPAGAYLLPVERMRRYVTPADINGTGRIVQYDGQHTRTARPTRPRRRPVGPRRVLQLLPAAGPARPGLDSPAAGTTAVTFPWTSGSPTRPRWSRTSTPAVWRDSSVQQQQPAARLRVAAVPQPELHRRRLQPPALGGVPVDLNTPPDLGNPTCPTLPTYDVQSNGTR